MHPEIPRVHLQRIRHMLTDATNSLRRGEGCLMRSCAITNSIEVVFIPSLRPEGRDHAEVSSAQQRVLSRISLRPVVCLF